MRLQPTQKFEVQEEYEILASYEVVREVVNGITIDSAAVTADGTGKKILKKGQPVSKMASGKYVPYNAGGADGSQNPSVLLKHTVDVTAGDVVTGGYEVAKVITERIPVAVDATLKGKMPNIVFA
jgi:hypothetical protein